jgi:CheY-like chemotaxis protein
MPGMSGEDLLERVKIDRPEQARRFVFMTGIGFGSDVERLVSEHGVKVLEKPFPMDVGLRAIASAMADRGPTDPHPGDVAAPPGEPSVTRSA